jgi:hypothetical protein
MSKFSRFGWLTERLSFWWEAIRSAVWLFVFLGWTVFCFATQIRDNFLPPNQQKRLGTLDVLARFNWRTWLIGVLVILVLATLEGAYRVHRRRLTATKKEHSDKLNAATQLAERASHNYDLESLKTTHLRKENERLSEEVQAGDKWIASLRERLAPRLQILFENTLPFVEDVQERPRVGKSGTWVIYRVGIKNLSSAELYGVTVELEDFHTLKRSYEGVPLRLMHETGELISRERIYDAPQNARFNIRPERTVYVDVVMRERHPAQGSNHKTTLLCFTKTFNFINSIGLTEPLVITIVASAVDAQPDRRRFKIYLDDQDQLQMEPLES